MMALISRVADCKQGIPGDLALDGKHVVFRIGDIITIVKVRVRADRNHGMKVESGIRILGRHVVRWEGKWKWIDILRTVSGVGERCGEEWRRGAQIVISEWRDAVHDSGGKPGKRGVDEDRK